MIKKLLGILLIAAGTMFGFISIGLVFSDGLFNILFMIIFAYPLYILGQWMRLARRISRSSI
ncbi:hypothetical protein JSQ81_05280 [Sporosarcina sp. Marseille-Q4063]|uniref:hypothetical protein n=1 Tax=Sporosarcina sp. Marseille-Q4063 TaxID=2810514 RepID=UPI001BAE6515|nr:hypothetical protein [Sporosarcina sp. Marseille-Q4063]QUW22987.1 hypothetical protein JSQ81_05280 [Sporosarcina sp. Marseille-Q4063]